MTPRLAVSRASERLQPDRSLDLDEPTRVIGRLRRPLLHSAPDERDGYVPNFVHSCGAIVHAGTLVLPYGISDACIGIATVSLADLLGSVADSAGD